MQADQIFPVVKYRTYSSGRKVAYILRVLTKPEFYRQILFCTKDLNTNISRKSFRLEQK